MSIHSNLTEQDMINLPKLAEQQKNQRSLKIKKGILKQTRDIKITECLNPITKKLDTIIGTNKKLGEVLKNLMLKMETLKYQLFKI